MRALTPEVEKRELMDARDNGLGETARRAKIVATLGPASSTEEMFRTLVRAGLDVARLNFSNGSHEQKAELIAMVRKVSREESKPICILADLQGPKIRTGTLVDLAQVARLAVTGRTASPPIFDVLALVGRDEVLAKAGILGASLDFRLAKLIDLLMQKLNLQFRLDVDLIVVFGGVAVDVLLTVLTHHDDRRRVGGLERQRQIQQNKGIRIPLLHVGGHVENNPDHQDDGLQDDECPGAHRGRDRVSRRAPRSLAGQR